MSLRITGGHLRGRVLEGVPAGVRPTASRVREALFSMVGQDLRGWSVLDAFGGTGLLALEAVSRGAAPVVVVERRRDVARWIAETARGLGVGPPELVVTQGEAETALAGGSWDLVLLDPPYDDDPAAWASRAAGAARRVLVIEHRRGARMPEILGPLALDRTRGYGDTALALYRPRAADG